MTQLPVVVGNHLLWPDGCISVDPDEVTDFIFKLSNKNLDKLFVTEITPEIQEYNSVSDHRLTVKTESSPIDLEWRLPEHYKYIDLDVYLIGLVEMIEEDELYDKRLERLSQEICLFKELGLEEVLKTLIYVIDVMKSKNIVWGVGRGSSCSSYLLFLLGLHEVDPVKYDIEITDFIRPNGD